MLIENLELTTPRYEKLLALAEKERVPISDILLRAIDVYLAGMEEDYDLEDVTDSIKLALIDVRDGNISSIEEVLNGI